MVTRLRAAGYAIPINFALRFGYGLWIAAWIYGILLVVSFFHGWHFIPTPFDLIDHLAAVWSPIG
jgi:hypothetical protein